MKTSKVWGKGRRKMLNTKLGERKHEENKHRLKRVEQIGDYEVSRVAETDEVLMALEFLCLSVYWLTSSEFSIKFFSEFSSESSWVLAEFLLNSLL
jgi:hypothetical protein